MIGRLLHAYLTGGRRADCGVEQARPQGEMVLVVALLDLRDAFRLHCKRAKQFGQTQSVGVRQMCNVVLHQPKGGVLQRLR